MRRRNIRGQCYFSDWTHEGSVGPWRRYVHYNVTFWLFLSSPSVWKSHRGLRPELSYQDSLLSEVYDLVNARLKGQGDIIGLPAADNQPSIQRSLIQSLEIKHDTEQEHACFIERSSHLSHSQQVIYFAAFYVIKIIHIYWVYNQL